MKPVVVEMETEEGFPLVITIDDDGVHWEWWSPGGKFELGLNSKTHEEMKESSYL